MIETDPETAMWEALPPIARMRLQDSLMARHGVARGAWKLSETPRSRTPGIWTVRTRHVLSGFSERLEVNASGVGRIFTRGPRYDLGRDRGEMAQEIATRLQEAMPIGLTISVIEDGDELTVHVMGWPAEEVFQKRGARRYTGDAFYIRGKIKTIVREYQEIRDDNPRTARPDFRFAWTPAAG